MNRDFKGIWIPREVWLAEKLSCSEKCLWAEIHSLFDREKGGCYATNEYLSEFCGVQERRLREMISNLKALGWLEQVSFDGRTRVLKAVVPPEDFKPVLLGAGQTGGKVPPPPAEKCRSRGQETAGPSYSIDTTREKTIDSPPIPPHQEAAPPNAAKAADERISKSKKPKPSYEFSPEVRDLAKRMVEALHEANPDWLIPKNLHHVMTQIHEMETLEKRDLKRIYDVFMWAVGDSFWMDKLCKPNPAKYLRQQFAQLAGKMEAKPAPKERKFAPSSNDARGLVALREWEKTAL